jgi:hypothetical protein
MDGVRWGKGGILAENNELGRLKEGVSDGLKGI